MEELRPEFVDQMMILRKKVMHRIKPKKLNGKDLNGAMLWNLMKSYVESINKGAIPSIESSWVYICKNECQNAQDNSYDVFVKNIQKEMEEQGGPFEDSELKDIYHSAKKAGLSFFDTKAVGEVKERYLEDLKEKIKQKYQLIKTDNDEACK